MTGPEIDYQQSLLPSASLLILDSSLKERPKLATILGRVLSQNR
jgi:hypothetical protein